MRRWVVVVVDVVVVGDDDDDDVVVVVVVDFKHKSWQPIDDDQCRRCRSGIIMAWLLLDWWYLMLLYWCHSDTDQRPASVNNFL